MINDYHWLSIIIYCPWDLGVSNFETLDKSGVQFCCKVKLSRSWGEVPNGGFWMWRTENTLMKHTWFYGSLAMVIISDFPWEHHHHMIHMLLMFVKQPFPNLSSMGGILCKKPSNYAWFIIYILFIALRNPRSNNTNWHQWHWQDLVCKPLGVYGFGTSIVRYHGKMAVLKGGFPIFRLHLGPPFGFSSAVRRHSKLIINLLYLMTDSGIKDCHPCHPRVHGFHGSNRWWWLNDIRWAVKHTMVDDGWWWLMVVDG